MLKVFIRNYLIFTAILLGCVGGIAYLLIAGDKQIDRSDDWVIHSHKVIIEVEQFNSLIAQMVASQRGYMISQNEDFMEEFETKKTSASRSLAVLSDLSADNLSQQSRLQELRQYFTEFSERLEDRAERSLSASPRTILENVENINRLQENISRINQDFLSEEYALLNLRVHAVESKKNQYFLTLLIGGGVAVILLMIFNGYLLRVQSKRTEAESALSEKEEVFRLAMEGTNDGVFDWNIQTGEVFYSSQFAVLLGYEAEEFEGSFKDFEDKLHPDEKNQVLEHIQLYQDGQLSEYENTFRMRHNSGRWVWIRCRANLIRDKYGKAQRMVGAHTDVSAAKEYEQRLQDAKDNQRFINVIADFSH